MPPGCGFTRGYPITPSTEIAEIMSHRLPAAGGRFIQMEDEIGSMAAIIGASIAGLKAMTATSGPGFSLMQENIGLCRNRGDAVRDGKRDARRPQYRHAHAAGPG